VTMEKHSKSSKKVRASEVNKLVKNYIQQNAETKSFDTGFGSSVDSTGVITKISTIPQGDTDSTRDGDQANVFSIELRGSLAIPSTGDQTNVLRIICFRWMQDDSSAGPAGVTDILQTLTPYSPYDRDNFRAKKFLVLHDELVGASITGPAVRIFSFKLDKQFRIGYQATATTGTSNVYIASISDSGASVHPVVSWVSRVWFKDY